MSRRRTWPAGAPVLAAVVLAFGPSPALGTSYLVSDVEKVTSGNPPCDAERITTYKVKIRNDNGPLLFCTEDVKPLRKANFVEMDLDSLDQLANQQQPLGSLEFLGFKTSEDGTDYDSTFEKLGLEAGSDKEITVFFDVRTGPKSIPVLGLCDFEEASFGVTVCDGGGGCDIGPFADPANPVCESPKATHKITLKANTSTCPASADGTASLQGVVTDSDDRRVGNARVTVTRGCRGSAGFVNKTDTTQRFANRGEYEITGLPAPATYTIEARDNGICKTTTVSISAAGASVTKDLKLDSTCNN